MRHLLTFTVLGDELAATLDDADGDTGLIMVSGGGQTRVGSHRMGERLAKLLASQGYPCFRYDRRGVGDSSGDDPGFRGSRADLLGAISAFRASRPGLRRVIGLGLCDGATALALHAGSEMDGLILANPWLVEPAEEMPPPAAIRSHYRQRLASIEGWRRLATGALSWRKLVRGLQAIATEQPSSLAAAIADTLRQTPLPIILILAERDATAIAAKAEWGASRNALPAPLTILPIGTDSHTFARPGDDAALLGACLDALARLQAASEASNSISLR